MAEVRDIFADILKMLVMKKLENELRLINLKEWITNHPEVVNRMVQIIGTNQGWKELCVELKSPYNIVRRLKDMPICEFVYTKRDFTIMRHEVYKQTVERIIHETKRQPIIIVSSPAAVVEFEIMANKSIEVTTVLKNRMTVQSYDPKEDLIKVKVKHDTNSPIFITGDIEQFVCKKCRLTECNVKHCKNLIFLDLSDNNIRHFVVVSTLNLNTINLANNPIEIMDIRNMLSQLKAFSKKDLFDEAPVICLTTEITDDIRVKLKQLDWKVMIANGL